MICLCCGKPMKENAKPEELINGWHNSCVRHFFGTKELPELNLSADTIESIADECTKRGFTVPGVQKKLSLHLSNEKNDKVRLTLVGNPAGYILKPQTADYPALPEAEHLVMQMAKATGIRTVPFALIRLTGSGEFAYITKRIDRTADGDKLAMEDFCQLDLRVTADKYKGSYERCGKIVKEYTENPGLDMTELVFADHILICRRKLRYAPQKLLPDRNFTVERRIPAVGSIRPAPRQHHSARRQGSDGTHAERKKPQSSSRRFPRFSRKLRSEP